MPLEVQGDYSTWRYDDTLISGIYTAHLGPPLLQSQLFAVNLMTAESDLATISQDELQNEVWPRPPAGLRDLLARRGHALPLAGGGPSAQLHVGLLYAVVGLLLLESVLAWRLGYNRR